jgi:predicted ATPase
MALHQNMRKLANKWEVSKGWPKRLEWIEIAGIRGWTGQRIDFTFPFVAIVGENGSGKSTILQAVASIYKSPSPDKSLFASDFFPDTAWEVLTNASIKYSVREGSTSVVGSVRKPSTRWRGNPERRERHVIYIDLRRTQPMASQVGYSRIAKPQFKEATQSPFSQDKLRRFAGIVGRPYSHAGYSLTDADNKRWVPVVQLHNNRYSGFHQGAGEITLAELIRDDIPNCSIVLIDEIETSLHPRAQRRLIRDLAEICRQRDLQVIITTHSSYVLDELPNQGRAYVMSTSTGRQLVTGVSPFFAMTQMDEERHPEIDLYMEDDRARILLEELITAHKRELLPRCAMIPYGAASVGTSLG